MQPWSWQICNSKSISSQKSQPEIQAEVSFNEMFADLFELASKQNTETSQNIRFYWIELKYKLLLVQNINDEQMLDDIFDL